MKQYIEKSVIVAEIENRKRKLLDHIISESDKEWAIRTAHQLNRIIWFINTLEVKEVDLEKELNDFIEKQKAWVKDDRVVEYNNGDSFNHIYDLEPVAKHFFELGLKTQKGDEDEKA